MDSWSLEEIMKLPIEKITTNRSFVLLWCATEHLDDGRACFKKWGLKRCEDIVWIKSNIKNN